MLGQILIKAFLSRFLDKTKVILISNLIKKRKREDWRG